MEDEISKYFKKMRRSFSHFIILTYLNSGGQGASQNGAGIEIHGYELKKKIESEFGESKEFFENDSSIYPVLSDLKKKGLVDFRTRIVSGRTQKLYFITDKGKELLPEMERQYMYFNTKIRGFFSSLADHGLKLTFDVNMNELEGDLDNKLLNLTLYDLRQAIREIPMKEDKMKYIHLVRKKLDLLNEELKKIEKQLKVL